MSVEHAPGLFDVFAEMFRRQQPGIDLFRGWKRARKVKAGTEITIVIEGDWVQPIADGTTLVALLLVDRAQYLAGADSAKNSYLMSAKSPGIAAETPK